MSAPAVFHTFFDLLYPRFCVLCLKNLAASPDWYLCSSCRDALPFLGPDRCRRCAKPQGPYVGVLDHCLYCRTKAFSFRETVACLRYEGAVQTLIQDFKFRRQTFLAVPLSQLLVQGLRKADFQSLIDGVLPVPLHPQTLRQRDFNQSALLAQGVVKAFSWISLEGAVIKRKPTPFQVRLSHSERQTNLEGAFEVRRPQLLFGKSILLLDDVFTTGATLQEMTKTLKHAGVKAVYAAVLARA